jgi:hypothetical protein
MTFMSQKASFSTFPPHIVVPMPALSPVVPLALHYICDLSPCNPAAACSQTMESGSIAKWILKEGDKFEAGTAICEVESPQICSH